jgi:hypothetical protein
MFPPDEEIKFFFSCPQTGESGVSGDYNRVPWNKNE